jgi:signal transduction histidine kinase
MPGSKTLSNRQTRLIRVLAHDLRNPISGILAASQCLIEDAVASLDSQQVTLLRSIESSSDLMLRLIDDMLEVAHASALPPKLRLRPSDLSRLVEQSVEVYRPLAEQKSLLIHVRHAGDLPTVNLDAVKMAHALNNLLAGVVRASPPGGRLEIELAARGRNVVVTARHSGFWEKLPSPDPAMVTAKRIPHEASTLMLSAVRLIVQRHGGTVRVEKTAVHPGFTLRLPKAAPRTKAPAKSPRHSPLRRSSANG